MLFDVGNFIYRYRVETIGMALFSDTLPKMALYTLFRASMKRKSISMSTIVGHVPNVTLNLIMPSPGTNLPKKPIRISLCVFKFALEIFMVIAIALYKISTKLP